MFHSPPSEKLRHKARPETTQPVIQKAFVLRLPEEYRSALQDQQAALSELAGLLADFDPDFWKGYTLENSCSPLFSKASYKTLILISLQQAIRSHHLTLQNRQEFLKLNQPDYGTKQQAITHNDPILHQPINRLVQRLYLAPEIFASAELLAILQPQRCTHRRQKNTKILTLLETHHPHFGTIGASAATLYVHCYNQRHNAQLGQHLDNSLSRIQWQIIETVITEYRKVIATLFFDQPWYLLCYDAKQQCWTINPNTWNALFRALVKIDFDFVARQKIFDQQRPEDIEKDFTFDFKCEIIRQTQSKAGFFMHPQTDENTIAATVFPAPASH